MLERLALLTRSFRCLAREGWGVKLDIFRILFRSIFYPIMMYGVVIWGWRAMHQITCDRFDRAIRMYGLMATRCQKTTPNALIFNLLKTQSFKYLLKFEVLKVSVQQFQLVHTKRQKVYEHYLKARISREVPQCMDHHMYMCRRGVEQWLSNIEFNDVRKCLCVHPADWVYTKTHIQDKTHAAWSGSNMVGWNIFTNASAMCFSKRWVFTGYHHSFYKVLRYGSLSRCSVFTAEMFAILEAVIFARTITSLREKKKIDIRSDSQATVQMLQKVIQTEPLQSEINKELRLAKHEGRNIVLRWVPNHSDIQGNEMTDKMAKRACDTACITKLPIYKRDIRRYLKELEDQEKERVYSSSSARTMRMFLPNLIDMNAFVNASPSVVVCQLVLGHSRLNDLVCRILGLIKSPMCKCELDKETVTHFLFECPLYKEIRKEIWPDFQLEYCFVTKDWKKMQEFVEDSRVHRWKKGNVF